jgi:Xaa-Pro dipeptidase
VPILKAEAATPQFGARSRRIREKCEEGRCNRAVRRIGMADERPSVPTPFNFAGANGWHIEANMVICEGRLIGKPSEPELVKPETQVLVTENGPVRLDSFPLEES